MKTSKAFSTISYNTREFLQVKLQDLVNRQVISFYTFVYHYAEEDEKKDHIHLTIFPNGMYQTDSLKDYLSEPDLSDLSAKPLGIMPCVSSKWDDWYLYCSHDASYLASKGQTRKYHYLEQDFVSSDEDYLHEIIRTIDRTKYAKTQDFVKAVQDGQTLTEMLTKGQIPAPQFNQWLGMYNFLKFGETYRNGRDTHSPLTVKPKPTEEPKQEPFKPGTLEELVRCEILKDK